MDYLANFVSFFLIAVITYMLERQPDPKKYEDYTRQILNDERVQKYLEKYFHLSNLKIKPKKKLPGKKTGVKWEVDGYGYDTDNNLVLIECKHYSSNKVKSNKVKSNKVKQNVIAAFAYIIQDVEAKHGVVVTTLGLQSGAKQIAESENIGLIVLDYNSTDKNFKITFNTLDEPTQENPSHSVMALTDKIHIGCGLVSSSVVTNYPLEEALERLRQNTNRVNFSEAEIIEEAKRMVEASNEERQ